MLCRTGVKVQAQETGNREPQSSSKLLTRFPNSSFPFKQSLPRRHVRSTASFGHSRSSATRESRPILSSNVITKLDHPTTPKTQANCNRPQNGKPGATTPERRHVHHAILNKQSLYINFRVPAFNLPAYLEAQAGRCTALRETHGAARVIGMPVTAI